jgi:adenylate cyclase
MTGRRIAICYDTDPIKNKGMVMPDCTAMFTLPAKPRRQTPQGPVLDQMRLKEAKGPDCQRRNKRHFLSPATGVKKTEEMPLGKPAMLLATYSILPWCACPGSRACVALKRGCMAVEIERKFLVASDDWQDDVVWSVRLRDGLIASSERGKVRVRITDDKATLAVKGARTGLSREEYEYEIPVEDASALLERHCAGAILEKTRFFVPSGGFVWEVDVYSGILSGVVIAEIELPAEDTEFDRPSWVGIEVTGQGEYRKINMLNARLSGKQL